LTLPRFAFAGTAPFAGLVLAGLIEAGLVPVVVVTNPDKPRGRHGTPQAPAIKTEALGHGLTVVQPPDVSSDEGVAELLGYRPDVFVVCAYGQLVRQPVLDAVQTVVVHPSLVPHWRGAAPVERALMAGETELGVTVLRMTAGLDEGPVGDARTVHVPADADAGQAYELLAPAAVRGVAGTLARIADGSVVWREQEGEPSYAAKIGPDDKVIDWSRPAAHIVNQVRALSPFIGATTELLGKRTRLWRVTAGSGRQPAPSGECLALAAGDGWVDVLELQQEGRTRMSAAEFLRGAGRALAQP
jgi:methionyl-tRNA formyltransferase